MDYTKIHKENVILEGILEDNLYSLRKNERKAMDKKVEELDAVRKKIEAVRSRATKETTDLLTLNRSASLQRHFLQEGNLTQAQIRINAERGKFSSKSMFNVRRNTDLFGFENASPWKRVPRLVCQPQSNVEENRVTNTTNDDSTKPKLGIGYRMNTFSSLAAFRPLTANVTFQRKQENDILPPRSKSAILCSWSRRQLELLCRVAPIENEPQITGDFKVDWKVIDERRRRQHLDELKVENDSLQSKVHNFVKEVELFNKRPVSKRMLELNQEQGPT